MTQGTAFWKIGNKCHIPMENWMFKNKREFKRISFRNARFWFQCAPYYAKILRYTEIACLLVSWNIQRFHEKNQQAERMLLFEKGRKIVEWKNWVWKIFEQYITKPASDNCHPSSSNETLLCHGAVEVRNMKASILDWIKYQFHLSNFEIVIYSHV